MRQGGAYTEKREVLNTGQSIIKTIQESARSPQQIPYPGATTMYDDLFKAAALLIILYAVYHLIRLIRNIIEESRKIDKGKEPENH